MERAGTSNWAETTGSFQVDDTLEILEGSEFHVTTSLWWI